MLIALKFEGKVLSVNSQTVQTIGIDGEVGVVASADMQLEARTSGGRAGHGLSILGDLACVALDEGRGLILEGVDRFFDGKIRGKEHYAHGGIGVLPADLLHRPGVGGIVDTEDASPLDSCKNRLGL